MKEVTCSATGELQLRTWARKCGQFVETHREAFIQLFFLAAGLAVIMAGLTSTVFAQNQRPMEFQGHEFAQAAKVILDGIEGSFGALVMVSAGIGAILSSAFGQYRAALSLLVVAVGSFVLRSLVGTFFNTAEIDRLGQ